MEFPSFGGQGRSIDLLDEQLILLGDNKLGGKFEYKSIHQPRKGLLGMKFTKEVSPLATVLSGTPAMLLEINCWPSEETSNPKLGSQTQCGTG